MVHVYIIKTKLNIFHQDFRSIVRLYQSVKAYKHCAAKLGESFSNKTTNNQIVTTILCFL